MEDQIYHINTKIIQPSANIKEPTTVITPNKLEILDYINIPPDSLKNNGLKSTSIFTFSKKMFMEKYLFENSSNILFRPNEKMKALAEKVSKGPINKFQDDNFDRILQEYSTNLHSEENSSLLGDLDEQEIKKALKKNNEIIDKDHTIKTESGIENEKGKTIQNQIDNKTQQSHETNICTEKGNIDESNKEYENERYFASLEILDLETQKDKIDEEKEFFSNIIRLFPSEKNKEINIMEINPEFFLKDFNTNHYFEGKYYMKTLNDECYISFPDWFYKKEYFTLQDIMVSLFELNIILTWYFKVEQNHIDIGEISENYKENYLTILLFENLCDPKKIDNIIEKEILSEEKITEYAEKIRKDTAKLEQENKIKNELLEIKKDFKRKDKCPEEIRKELKEEIFGKLSKTKNENKIKALLDILSLNFYSLMNGERFIRLEIRKYIIDYFKPFLRYITRQIAIYSKKTVDNKKKISFYFTYIYNLIKERLEIIKSKYEIKIIKYGSFASGLFIEGSDMDLLIYYKESKDSIFCEDLSKLFTNYKNIIQINKIDGKNLITLNFFFEDFKLEDPYNYINTNKNYPPINQIISVDIAYTSNGDEFYKKKKIVEKIFKKLKEGYYIIFCLFVLKRSLVINNLNKIYYGGLSSYGIQSLAFQIDDRIIKNPTERTKSGEFLFIFFERYSKFDFYRYVVEKDGNKRTKKTEHPKTLKNPEYYENMIAIDDPMDEDNLIKGGYTPRKFFKDKPKNYICEKIRTLFQKEFEVFKNCYLEFSNKIKKENTSEDNMDFILKLFSVKIGNK